MHVIVIGGGVIGCAIAYELASRGAGVTLVEKQAVCTGATQASAGVLCPWIGRYDSALLPLLVSSVAMFDEFVLRAERDSGLPIEFRRNGTLEVALSESEASQLQVVAEGYLAAGLDHQFLVGGEALDLEPALTQRVIAGLHVPSHGYTSAASLTQALVRAAARAGALIQEDREVQGIAASGDGVRLTTGDESLIADAVVVAAGAWSGQLAVHATPPVPVKPIRGQLLRLRSDAPLVSRSIWSTGCYLVPWVDGTLLVGATYEDVGFTTDATVAGVRSLLEGACDVLPGLAAAVLERVCVGLRPSTGDGFPIVGRSGTIPGLVYATGHHRNGVMLAPLTAQLVANLVLDGMGSPHLSLTAPGRFGL